MNPTKPADSNVDRQGRVGPTTAPDDDGGRATIGVVAQELVLSKDRRDERIAPTDHRVPPQAQERLSSIGVGGIAFANSSSTIEPSVLGSTTFAP